MQRSARDMENNESLNLLAAPQAGERDGTDRVRLDDSW